MIRIATLIALISLSAPTIGFAKYLPSAAEKKEANLRCLARNIYFESRGQDMTGQMAIAFVTLERVDLTGDSICQVVREPSAFSWTSNRSRVRDKKAYEKAQLAAQLAIIAKRNGLDPLRADHFHSKHLRKYPKWTKKCKYIKTIGDHRFYRSKSVKV